MIHEEDGRLERALAAEERRWAVGHVLLWVLLVLSAASFFMQRAEMRRLEDHLETLEVYIHSTREQVIRNHPN